MQQTDTSANTPRLSARWIKCIASIALVSLSACSAVEDFSTPIPDEPITQEEYLEGGQAVEAISSGGVDPAFDNAEPSEDTDGDTAGLAPEQPEPSAAQVEADVAMVEQAQEETGDAVDPTPPNPEQVIYTERELVAEDDGDPNTAASVHAHRAGNCRRAAGYIRGRSYPICVTTVDGKLVEVRTAAAYVRMRAAARRAGIRLRIISGFRTMQQQRYLYRLFRIGRGNLAARPGYSNHQSGLALDLNTRSLSIYRWLSRNAGRFGFRRTVRIEPWHWERR